MIHLGMVLAGAMACTSAPADPPAPDAVSPRVYLGAADASAAVALDRGLVLVGDDEDNVLRLYDVERGGMPQSTLDVSDFLGLSAADEADIEAAARVGRRIYWITSHGPGRRGKPRATRQRLFAITVADEDRGPVLRPFGRPCTGLLPALTRALDDALGASRREAVDIEALAVGADGQTLWIGLRAPLVPRDGAALAIAVPLRNASAVVEHGDDPDLGPPALWDLGGRTPRDMLWSADRRQVFVLGGAAGAQDGWELFRWSGRSGDPPQPAAVDGIPTSGIQPEALVELEAGGRLLILSDDGERRVAVGGPDECARRDLAPDGTCANKRLKDARRRSFRGYTGSP